jgi:hypothetical protein
VQCNPLVCVPQTDLRDLDILRHESYNGADPGCQCAAQASGRSADPVRTPKSRRSTNDVRQPEPTHEDR